MTKKDQPVKDSAVEAVKLPPMTNIAVGMDGSKVILTVDKDQVVAQTKKGDEAKFEYCADTRGFIHIGDMMIQVKVMRRKQAAA